MQPSALTRSAGLVLTGFLAGVIVTSLNRHPDSLSDARSRAGAPADYRAMTPEYEWVARTDVWDVFVERSAEGRSIALGQRTAGSDPHIRIVVTDDKSALYVMTYMPGDPVWQGRLMDVGNDGTVEVADLSYGHCEAFSPP